MLARKCDVCGEFYDFRNITTKKKPNNFVSKVIEIYDQDDDGDIYNGVEYDVCPDCYNRIMDLIYNIMDEKEKNEDEKE